MGVELGKILAKNILAQLGKPEDVTGHDSSVRLTPHPVPRGLLLTTVLRLPASFTTTRSFALSEPPTVCDYTIACTTRTAAIASEGNESNILSFIP